MKNFCRCKLCGEVEAAAQYKLPETVVYVCPRCDLHFIDYRDAPSPGENGGTGLDDRGRRYIEERLPATETSISLQIGLLTRYLALSQARCLDIGAGSGQFLHRLVDAGAQGEGIEPSRLRRQFAAEKFALRLSPEPIENPCWQEKFHGYFDAVTLWEVIEHVNDPLATARGACNVLKPGGWLFLETHSRAVPAYSLSEWSYRLSRGRCPLFLGNFYTPTLFGHKQIFTKAQIALLVKKSGFEVIFQGGFFPDAKAPMLKKRDNIILVARKT